MSASARARVGAGTRRSVGAGGHARVRADARRAGCSRRDLGKPRQAWGLVMPSELRLHVAANVRPFGQLAVCQLVEGQVLPMQFLEAPPRIHEVPGAEGSEHGLRPPGPLDELPDRQEVVDPEAPLRVPQLVNPEDAPEVHLSSLSKDNQVAVDELAQEEVDDGEQADARADGAEDQADRGVDGPTRAPRADAVVVLVLGLGELPSAGLVAALPIDEELDKVHVSGDLQAVRIALDDHEAGVEIRALRQVLASTMGSSSGRESVASTALYRELPTTVTSNTNMTWKMKYHIWSFFCIHILAFVTKNLSNIMISMVGKKLVNNIRPSGGACDMRRSPYAVGIWPEAFLEAAYTLRSIGMKLI
eukprot:CAMPEP_0204511766 /NCGR_PEP_ID=MMETSP0661-20131031/603_1 /ASSEMBLY_ACC=CAM_ASM_000606 /TAXON_ID=109239 /ORGANISM="Alexandrium margalefi, Strain AMGDE01CS-322" /LENGTH=360 /DNA_ID=CAMNT_0051516863 /DNA_START=194 /DNA_END=1277 /DNA_ORIENTATION=-